MRGLLYACLVAINLWDDESWHVLSERHVRLARDAGALTVLPLALEMHCASQVNAGEFAAAQALIDEADAITDAAGSVPLTDAPLLLAGWRGDERAALERIARRRPRRRRSGRGDARSRSRSTRRRCCTTGSAVTSPRSPPHSARWRAPSGEGLSAGADRARRSGRAQRASPSSRRTRSSTCARARRSAAPTGRSGWRPARARS